MKKTFPSELAYIVGLVALAIGVALMQIADFGMSVVVAPAYLLHVKVSQVLPFFSFGMAEYCLQALLLVILALVLRKPRIYYLFSFVTAFVYGMILDGAVMLIGMLPQVSVILRHIYYVTGLLTCSFGVAMMFETYIAPEAYELFVKEISAHGGGKTSRVKTIYDICSCSVGIILSFAFFGFGRFEGVKIGTILCALVNGSCIGMFTRLLHSRFEFADRLPFRSFFTPASK